MKKSFLRIIVLSVVVFTIALVVHSCKKREPDTDTVSATDNSICEGEFSRIFPQVNHIAVGDSGVQKNGYFFPLPESACPDYYIDSADVADGFPVTMWLFYGSDNDGDSIYEQSCTGSDGKVRSGIIRAIFSAPWMQPGSTITHILKNFYVNSILYEGTVSVTRNAGAATFTQTVTNGKCSKGSNWTILWNSSRTVTTLMGDTLNPYDDVCLISGSADGTDRRGKTFSADIDPNNPLRREMGCTYIVKGIQTIKMQGKMDRTIDYGDGTCDNKAKLIIDGNEFEFSLQ